MEAFNLAQYNERSFIRVIVGVQLTDQGFDESFVLNVVLTISITEPESSVHTKARAGPDFHPTLSPNPPLSFLPTTISLAPMEPLPQEALP